MYDYLYSSFKFLELVKKTQSHRHHERKFIISKFSTCKCSSTSSKTCTKCRALKREKFPSTSNSGPTVVKVESMNSNKAALSTRSKPTLIQVIILFSLYYLITYSLGQTNFYCRLPEMNVLFRARNQQ